ncbi:EAL domain-containing protein [Sinorhizobium saheli]|uniref:Histidine kinase n=1 Tax=Sinorhizobium saheli TaxID=36856 RepID=A0A178YHD4_SINSA|nr:EAL domain-containing protein [Sinorhizobium saheli]MQW88886.1 EAL domain-containing protein [Sinorhizobium saheli]OAP46822.1 histidine kinase [Sinorhizobium saheli]
MNVKQFNSAVAVVTAAMQEARVGFSLQEVHAADEPGDVLYSECLARLVERNGTVRTGGEFIGPLETVGCAPLFDRHLLGIACDWLVSHPAQALGCNLSADNLSDDCSRTALYDLLSSHRAIASRLVLEITESLPITALSAATELLQALRALGYRIAADDFGTGYSTPESLLSIPVDIVKIDAFFVQHRSDSAERVLRHMVGLASCAAPTVIVEGIETYAQLDAARVAGATHVQGYLLSEPTLPPVHCG